MTTVVNETKREPSRNHEKKDLLSVVQKLGPTFAARAGAHDANDAFVAANYADLKEHKLFSAGVPQALGGGGASHSELCEMLRRLARHCPSTALALFMHQHLVAANVWKVRHGQPGEGTLRRVAEKELVLVSTGARDWLASNGEVKKVDGGYRVSAKKAFASACQAGDVLVTSAPFHGPQGEVVLHFPVPLSAEGVTVREDWRVLGMRGTGSHTVVLEHVFVPEDAVVLERPQGEWHGVWNVILTVAMPLIMSVYVGAAEAAAGLAKGEARRHKNDPHLPYLLGEMENQLVTAQLALKDMVATANDYDFEPTVETANRVLVRKTVAAKASLATVEKALETVGGKGFFRGLGLERLLRDVHGAQFHPLPEKEQQRLSGRLALGQEPL